MLKNLRYFVSLIEKKSYSRAAVQCGVSQSAVSKAVRKLEAEMNAVLVDYQNGECSPTRAGQICYEQAKEILIRYENMKRMIGVQNLTVKGQLQLVYLTVSYLRVFTPLQNSFQKRFPEIATEIRYDSYAQAKKQLAAAEIDGFLVAAAEVPDNPGCESIVIHSGQMTALIPKGNSLSEQETIRLSELCNERLIVFDPKAVPVLAAAYIDYCRSAGFTPHIVDYASKVAEAAAKAVLCDAIALVDGSSAYAANEALSAVPIVGTFPLLDICLIWNREHCSDTMKRLVDHCRGAL